LAAANRLIAYYCKVGVVWHYAWIHSLPASRVPVPFCLTSMTAAAVYTVTVREKLDWERKSSGWERVHGRLPAWAIAAGGGQV